MIGFKSAAIEKSLFSGIIPTPRYCDPIDSLAQTCEMDGDIVGAIAARKLEPEVCQEDWNCTTWESVDHIHREISRLKKCLRKGE